MDFELFMKLMTHPFFQFLALLVIAVIALIIWIFYMKGKNKKDLQSLGGQAVTQIPTVLCPQCKLSVSAGTIQCPKCGAQIKGGENT